MFSPVKFECRFRHFSLEDTYIPILSVKNGPPIDRWPLTTVFISWCVKITTLQLWLLLMFCSDFKECPFANLLSHYVNFLVFKISFWNHFETQIMRIVVDFTVVLKELVGYIFKFIYARRSGIILNTTSLTMLKNRIAALCVQTCIFQYYRSRKFILTI